MSLKTLICLLACLAAVCCGPSQSTGGLAGTYYEYVPSAVTNPVADNSDTLSKDEIAFLESHGPAFWRAPDQDTLRQVLFLHRHGDRTPINIPPKDQLASEPFWRLHGLGQLTNRGKARLFALGKIMRLRYNKFLAGSVNKNMRKSRASGSLRCIESAQVFLAAFLALNSQQSSDADELTWHSDAEDLMLSYAWQPASVNTLASKYDGMLNEDSGCSVLERETAALDASDEFRSVSTEFVNERRVLEREYAFVLDHFYKWVWASSLLEVEHSYFGPRMNPAVRAINLRVQQAGDRMMKLYQTRPLMRRARAGLLVNDIISNMAAMSENSTSGYNKKFVHYSAHDINLVFMMGILDNIDNMHHRPDYAANIIFELHEADGEWFIRLFYMSHVPTKPLELHIDACERGHKLKRCTLDKFGQLLEPYRVASWWQWMKECGNAIEGMDPYAQNT